MLRRFVLLLTLLASFTPSYAYAAKLRVVVTFSVLGDIVSRIGGDNIEVTTLVGPNADAHAFEPTPEAVKALENADLVVVNGISFEGWMGRLIVSSGYSGPVVVAAKNVTSLAVNDKLDLDPHAWQSISNVQTYIDNIRDAFIEADRPHSAKYKENAELFARELQGLEYWIKQQINSVPEDKRVVITTHDAFQYFGRYYGVRFLAPAGVTNESSPSAANLAKIEDQMRKEQIRAVFFENVNDDKLMKQLQQDVGAFIGGTLYTDALSGPNGPAPTYIAMMKHNVTQLVAGMQHNGALTAASPTLQAPDDSTITSIP